MTFLGDSWTAASGSESGKGYAALVGERLGWTYEVLGVAGTGYVQGAPDQAFAQRIPAAVDSAPDVVVVQGSLNDLRSDPRVLRPAVRETLAALEEAAGPGTDILVIGAPEAPGTDAAGIQAINDAIEEEATSLDLRFVDPVAQEWNDPRDPAIWADATHPNDAGYRLIADHVSALLRETVDD
ncbi:SGNH/GDSL hydrolase family protein [Blastococcus sp. SYSU D00922]